MRGADPTVGASRYVLGRLFAGPLVAARVAVRLRPLIPLGCVGGSFQRDRVPLAGQNEERLRNGQVWGFLLRCSNE